MKYFRSRTHRSGTTYYYFDRGGSPRKEIALGKDYVLAVRKWTELMATTEKKAVANFKDLADKYEREVVPLKAKSTQKLQASDLKLLRAFFCTPSPAPLDEIKPSHIHSLLQWKKNQAPTANRLKRTFSHMFNMARAWGYTEKPNPCAGIKGLPIKKREQYITDEVFLAVWAQRTRIAHNEQFDARIVRIACMRHAPTFADSWKAGRAECTQMLSTPILNLPPTEKMKRAGFNRPKSANLGEAYEFFTGRKLENAHSAMADTRACLEVFHAVKGCVAAAEVA